MNKTVTLTWIILLVLTMVSALIFKLESTYTVLMILILSVLKFIGISFQFMELKKAHLFWKAIVLGFVLTFAVVLLVMI